MDKFFPQILFAISILVLSACTTSQDVKAVAPMRAYGTQYDASLETLKSTQATCNKHVDNELLARQECFPLLKQKPVLVLVKEIKATDGVVMVSGSGGSERLKVLCKVVGDEAKAMHSNPTSVKVGDIFWATGKFNNYARDGYKSTFTLDECHLSK